MCRTVHAVLQSLICAIQMLVRIFITMLLMIENLIRMIMQTFYNFVSFMLQLVSLLPICVIFLVTSRLKCFMCGGGGPCQIKSGGSCDCLMSAVAIVIVFFILRATGMLDKIFYKLGYAKAKPLLYTRYVPTPGDITECSRNDSDYESSTVYYTDTDEDTSSTTQTSTYYVTTTTRIQVTGFAAKGLVATTLADTDPTGTDLIQTTKTTTKTTKSELVVSVLSTPTRTSPTKRGKRLRRNSFTLRAALTRKPITFVIKYI